MPKAVLIFNLPEEQHEFGDANNGAAYRGALTELREYLREMTKYGNFDGAKTKEELALKAYARLHEILNEKNLEL